MHSVAVKPAAPTAAPAAQARAWAGPVVAWGAWAVLTAGALGLVALYGSNVPYYDDWDIVDRITGTQPVTPDWLWELHNSHRLPAPKILVLGLFKLSGVDFRSEMVVSVAALSALAAALIGTARRVRGWTSFTDAFFPLLLLNWGLWKVLLWGWQMHVILPVALAGVPLLVMARQPAAPPLRLTLLAWVCIVLLPLCAAHGLAFVPALAVWLVYLAWVYWNAPHPRRRLRGLLVGGLAVLASLPVPLHYLVQYEKEDMVLEFSLRAAAATAVKFLTLGFGPVAETLWPLSGIAVLGLLGGAGLILAWNVLRPAAAGVAPAARAKAPRREPRSPGGRPRAVGLLLFLGGLASLAVGFGLGRSYRGNLLTPYWVAHYRAFPLPTFYFLYLAWAVYGPGRLLRVLVPGLLCAFQLLILPLDTYHGWQQARDMRREMAAFEQDLVRGEPVLALVSRHANGLCPTQTQYTTRIQTDLARRLRDLREARIGIFQQLRDDPPFLETDLPVAPAAVHQGTWEEGVFTAAGPESFIEFKLPEPRSLYGLQLVYSYVKTRHMFSEFRVAWKTGGAEAFPQEPQFAFRSYCPWAVPPILSDGPSEGDDPAIVVVRDTVDGFRIYPAVRGPCAFGIQKITLWVPAGVPTPAR